MAWWNGTPNRLDPGIGVEEYAQYDSVADERADPPLKYSIRNVTGTAQVEIWPMPASAVATLELTGSIKVVPLVDDADVCLLDAEAVILFAAAKLATGDNEDKAIKIARRRLERIRSRMPEMVRTRIGLGEADRIPAGRAVVRVR